MWPYRKYVGNNILGGDSDKKISQVLIGIVVRAVSGVTRSLLVDADFIASECDSMRIARARLMAIQEGVPRSYKMAL